MCCMKLATMADVFQFTDRARLVRCAAQNSEVGKGVLTG